MTQQRSQQQKTQQQKTKRRTWGILAAVAVVILTGVGAVSLAAGLTPKAPTVASQSSPPASPAVPDLARRVPNDPLALGSVSAPVVMIEYADFRCPFCAAFNRDTMPALIKGYVDTGVLRIEWRDFPVFGQQSIDAAVAARAAGEQGKFWQYHDALYALAPAGAHADLTRAVLIQTARTVGVADMNAFTRELDSPALLKLVQADAEQAQSLGASGTPSFLIGNQPIVGAQPLSVFQQAIDQQKTASGR
ncbi:MAG: DsbA family protein [Microbacteriaceae bacterium]